MHVYFTTKYKKNLIHRDTLTFAIFTSRLFNRNREKIDSSHLCTADSPVYFQGRIFSRTCIDHVTNSNLIAAWLLNRTTVRITQKSERILTGNVARASFARIRIYAYPYSEIHGGPPLFHRSIFVIPSHILSLSPFPPLLPSRLQAFPFPFVPSALFLPPFRQSSYTESGRSICRTVPQCHTMRVITAG